MRGFFYGVRLRLTLWYVLILAAVLLLCGGAIYVSERQALLSQLDGRVTARLHQLTASYDARGDRLSTAPDSAVAQGNEVVLLMTPAGRVVQMQALGRLSAVKEPWPRVVRTLQSVARRGDGSMVDQGLLLSVPAGVTKGGRVATVATAGVFRFSGLPLMTGDRVGALLLVGLRSDVARHLATLAQTLETVVPLILLLCAAAGYWLADRALHPVQTITRTAQRISATDLSQRLNLGRRDELGELGATIDGMLERLEAAFARQRQFTADASHELRTPLSIIDLEAAHALAQPRTAAQYRAALETVRQESGYLTRLIDDLLALARAESGQAVARREQVDMAEVALDVAERLEPLARQSAMQLCMDALPELCVWGERTALTRMVTAIVENALKYGAGSGTQVRLSGAERQQNAGAGVWLRIADDGPGIAAEHLPHLCERFYRVDQARTHATDRVIEGAADTKREDGAGARPIGSGLGLSIAQAIARAHDGDLRVRSEPGQGTSVEIWLPAHRPGSAGEDDAFAGESADTP